MRSIRRAVQIYEQMNKASGLIHMLRVRITKASRPKPRGLFLRIFLWEQRETKTGECTMMITHAKRAVYLKSRLFVSPARHSAVCDIEYR